MNRILATLALHLAAALGALEAPAAHAQTNLELWKDYVRSTAEQAYPGAGLPLASNHTFHLALTSGVANGLAPLPAAEWIADAFLMGDLDAPCGGPHVRINMSTSLYIPNGTLPQAVLDALNNAAAAQVPAGAMAQFIVFRPIAGVEFYILRITQLEHVVVGESYCVGAPNSTGVGAVIYGFTYVESRQWNITAQQLPSHVATLFIGGTAATQLPFGNGYRCVSGSLQRYPVQQSSVNGMVMLQAAPDDPFLSGFLTGSPRYLQCWYRDTAAGGAGFNLSQGIRMSACP